MDIDGVGDEQHELDENDEEEGYSDTFKEIFKPKKGCKACKSDSSSKNWRKEDFQKERNSKKVLKG